MCGIHICATYIYVVFTAHLCLSLTHKCRIYALHCTGRGRTGWVDNKRGVPQGDPLAPWMFLVGMNLLHEGLSSLKDKSGQPIGYRIGDEVITSKGYSDDTATITSSEEGVAIAHRFTLNFCKHYGLRMNSKSELRGIYGDGRELDGALSMDPDSQSMWIGEVDRIRVTDEVRNRVYENQKDRIEAEPGRPFKYLGIWIDTDGSWRKQLKAVTAMANWLCQVATSNSLTVLKATLLFNVFLDPKMRYHLQFLGPVKHVWNELRKLDTTICRTISSLARSEVGIRREAISSVTGLILPSTSLCIAFAACAADTLNKGGQSTRVARALWASGKGRWAEGVQALKKRTGFEMRRMKGRAIPSYPTTSERDSRVVRVNGKRVPLNTKGIYSWGHSAPPNTINFASDGSARTEVVQNEQEHIRTAWGVAVMDDNFHRSQHCLTSLSGEWNRLDVARSNSMTAFGAAGRSQEWKAGQPAPRASVYEGELEAIARTLLAAPLTWDVNLLVDSQSAIDAVTGPALPYRLRVKQAEHQLVRICRLLVERRERCGGKVQIMKVDAHVKDGSTESLANDLADAVAKIARVYGAEDTIDLDFGEEEFALFLRGERVRTNPWKALTRSIRKDNFSSWKKNSKSQKGLSAKMDLHNLREYVQGLQSKGAGLGDILKASTDTMLAQKRGSRDAIECQMCTASGRRATLDPDHLLDCPHDGGFQWESAAEELSSMVNPICSLDLEIPEWEDELHREILTLKSAEAIHLSNGTLMAGEAERVTSI